MDAGFSGTFDDQSPRFTSRDEIRTHSPNLLELSKNSVRISLPLLEGTFETRRISLTWLEQLAELRRFRTPTVCH